MPAAWAGGSAVALKRDAHRTSRKDDAGARYKADIERMRLVIAEITAEHLELKEIYDRPGFARPFVLESTLRSDVAFELPTFMSSTTRSQSILAENLRLRTAASPSKQTGTRGPGNESSSTQS